MGQNRKKLRQRLKRHWRALQQKPKYVGVSPTPGSIPGAIRVFPGYPFAALVTAYAKEQRILAHKRGPDSEDWEHEATQDCAACRGLRDSIMLDDDLCYACYEDGGPHAGDDPFGRSDEDWARHAE